jgi:predicted nucleotidyltransferase
MAPTLPRSGALTRDTILGRLRANYPGLRSQFGVARIGLFGSFAKGTESDGSDVDLIVDFERPVGLRFVELVDFLESLLGRRVDVLTPVGLRTMRLAAVASEIEGSLIHLCP